MTCSAWIDILLHGINPEEIKRTAFSLRLKQVKPIYPGEQDSRGNSNPPWLIVLKSRAFKVGSLIIYNQIGTKLKVHNLQNLSTFVISCEGPEKLTPTIVVFKALSEVIFIIVHVILSTWVLSGNVKVI